ncbi:hypothetical protein YpB42003004_1068 [Yersinia pestis biovar Antiqua str. B42003004]|uniref:Uncharacterized protein n=1 Tax=Yersinia pestis biovar Orientalis str. IP275 TaxID=373665 RepID=A0AAV3BI04_YERPE|nr:hypothetical protein YPIP275_1910 [Yersinia pestis biovar Orientalis str. IP275]EDR44847.1 hypothetical protein YpE1979001_1306 [Yersinia pestis biovar Antiqua str. E1979001]EDR49097.1 hypothetical protein YpB42003004_1068 [Yersinia pestis biovar Antiqua str. B42003004]EDR66174.1 hypothetical protein YpK1973002_3620 [Yersinia pestis biovar Mediaevalis str. K1973002]EIQ88580.1 hypothetical protein YPPY03_3218 [Yersinia pestis PY-03]EIR00259.1 hypothetical protein YPPY04_3169 [Yersinia pestis
MLSANSAASVVNKRVFLCHPPTNLFRQKIKSVLSISQ